MAEKVMNLDDLFKESLKDLYDAEQQIVKALPKLIDHAQAVELKQGLKDHLNVTERQIDRLGEIFKELKMPIQGKHCKGMEGILKEGDESLRETIEPGVRDAALIASAQKVEHYEIAGYGTARTYAQMLGHQNIAKVLDQIADEEGHADKVLTTLAESHINARAKG